jgi:hypothetical protein
MIIVLISCSGSTENNAAAMSSAEVPEIPELDVPAAEAQWSAADIEAAIEAAIVDGFPDAGHLQAAYLEVLSHGDTACPGHETYIDETWLYGCTADSGYWYSGVSEYVEESTSEYEAVAVKGDLRFEDPDGNVFSGGGHAAIATGSMDDQRFTVMELSGSWIWEGDPTASWLAGGISGSQNTRIGRSDSVDVIELTGAISFSGVSLDFEHLRLLSPCDWQPVGVMSIRDPTGIWHRLDYGETCSACAQGSWGETQLGAVCPDLSPIVETAAPYLKAL